PDREFAGIRAQQFLWGRRRGFRGFGGVLCAERDEEQHQQQVSKEPARQVDRWNPTAGACAASGQDHESSSRPPTSSSFRRRVTSCCTVLMKKASSSERAVNSSTARRKVLLDCSVKAPSLSWAVASSSETRSSFSKAAVTRSIVSAANCADSVILRSTRVVCCCSSSRMRRV